jgi:hypothetical protein
MHALRQSIPRHPALSTIAELTRGAGLRDATIFYCNGDARVVDSMPCVMHLPTSMVIPTEMSYPSSFASEFMRALISSSLAPVSIFSLFIAEGEAIGMQRMPLGVNGGGRAAEALIAVVRVDAAFSSSRGGLRHLCRYFLARSY